MTMKSERLPRESLWRGVKKGSRRSSGHLFSDSPPYKKMGLLAISGN